MWLGDGLEASWGSVEKEYLKRIAEMIARDMKRGSQGPRSRIVEAIAVLLYAKPMRASEIASILGFSSRYVSSYLSYWKNRGLFRYENGYWFLTEKGKEYAEEVLKRYEDQHKTKLLSIARAILAGGDTPTRNSKKMYYQHGQYHLSLPFLAARDVQTIDEQKPARSTCASRILEAYSKLLPADEYEVLRALLDHYTQWGKTYMYFDQIQEMLNADPRWLLNILKSLQSKGIVYVYHDKRMGVRIGISKQVKTMLDTCLAESLHGPQHRLVSDTP